jgi:hypothetical protein
MNGAAFGWAALATGGALLALVAAAFIFGILTRKHTPRPAPATE